MKKRFALLLGCIFLFLFSACALADETELLFRAFSMMDKTGDVQDFAVRAGIISDVRLREQDGAYTGKIRLRKASYTMQVEEGEGGGVMLRFTAQERAAMWSTIGSVAKTFDAMMTEIFGSPVWDVLRLDKGDTPAPRITLGSLNLKKIGESHREVVTCWRNRTDTIYASLTGWRSYRECAFTLTLQFGGSPEWAYTAEAADNAQDDEDWDEEDEDEEEETDEEEDEADFDEDDFNLDEEDMDDFEDDEDEDIDWDETEEA